MRTLQHILIALVILSANSCLPEDIEDEPTNLNEIRFFAIGVAGSRTEASHPLYIEQLSHGQKLSIIIGYQDTYNNNEDVTVTCEIDRKALEDYNIKERTDFELLPTYLYTTPELSVRIVSGQTKAIFEIQPLVASFDFSKKYVLPIKIKSTSSGKISNTFGTVLIWIKPKNRWDGVYTVHCEMDDLVLVNPSGLYPKIVELRTINSNTVIYYDQAFAAYSHIFNTGVGLGYFNDFVATFHFDKDDNVIDVKNGFGPDNKRLGKLNHNGINKFIFQADNSTPKTLEVSYIMQDFNTIGDRTFWKETFTYLHPR